jgi:hypothetical protein
MDTASLEELALGPATAGAIAALVAEEQVRGGSHQTGRAVLLTPPGPDSQGGTPVSASNPTRAHVIHRGRVVLNLYQRTKADGLSSTSTSAASTAANRGA